MKIVTIVGARPQFVKAAVVAGFWRELKGWKKLLYIRGSILMRI